MKITENIKYIGVDDHTLDLFEGQYIIPNGISYNSYIIFDEKSQYDEVKNYMYKVQTNRT